jgi:two-component system, NtrC family, response regulator HydG
VRIITATNKDLRELIDQKMFREDLFFRINVIPILLPPLRERTGDISLLINTFISRLQSQTGKKITGVSPEAMEWLMAYGWPGNVRELKSAMEYGFVIVESGLIHMAHLPPHIIEDKGERPNEEVFIDRREVHEKTALIDALKKSGGNQSQAARVLGISRVTVWNRMRKYGINLKRVMTP